MKNPKTKEIIFNFSASEIENSLDFTQIKSFISFYLSEFHKKKSFFLAFIFLTVDEIIDLNTKYLNHKHETDVITFDFSEDYGFFGGDIYLCPEVIKNNAKIYEVSYEEELLRVMFHGILHLLGYNDSTRKEKQLMRKEEDFLIKKFYEYCDKGKVSP